MKKILAFFVFLLFVSSISFASAQEEPNLILKPSEKDIVDLRNSGEAYAYVPFVRLSKPEYLISEKILGEFDLDNNSDVRRSDIYFTTSFLMNVNNEEVEIGTIKHANNLYLESKSRRTVTFERPVADFVYGDTKLVVKVFESNGALIGEKKVPVKINGASAKQIITFNQASIQINGEKFPLQSGPTVTNKDVLTINFKTGTITKPVSVIPTISLYNRTYESEPIKVLQQDEITLKSDTEYSLEIPSDLSALVYAGSVSFDQTGSYVTPLYFRYIIDGKIGTILNVNTSFLDGNEGDVIDVSVEYAGQPLAFNVSTSSDIIDDAEISVTLLNEKNEIIGIGNTKVSLQNAGNINIPVTLTKKSEKFSVKAIMKTGETVLSEYSVNLPTEKEVQDAYPSKSWTKIIIFVVALVLIVLIILFIVKQTRKYVPTIVALFIVGSAVMWGTQQLHAFYVHFSPTAWMSQYFKVNAILSPGPSESISYAPGEEFTVELNASYVACSNSGFTNTLYGPTTAWYTGKWTPQTMFSDWPTVYDYWGDYWGLGVNLPALENWWLNTKGGVKLYSISNTWGSGFTAVTSNEVTSQYNMTSSKVYTMPTTPGFYKFYFMLHNWARGHTATTRIVSQEVCVRGAGVCPGEEAVSVCSNLIGEYTQVNDVIYKDGEAQSLWMNPDTNECLSTPILSVSVNPGVTTADINWTYFDLKPQKNYKLELFINSGLTQKVGDISSEVAIQDQKKSVFASIVDKIKKITSTASAQGEQSYQKTFRDLTPNTTYWVKVNASNQDNVWGIPIIKSFSTLEDSNGFSCTGGVYQVGAQATYTASDIADDVYYQWYIGDNPISGANSRFYDETFNQEGSYQRKVVATYSDNTTITTSCYATITLDGNPPQDNGGDGEGDGGETGAPAQLSKFEFEPAHDPCLPNIEINNAISCSLTNRGGSVLGSWDVNGTTITIQNISLGVGTYGLSCMGTNGQTTNFGTRSCYSNSDIKED